MINIFVFDIDGTMTDSGVYYSQHGEEMVRFNRRDGYAIELLKNNRIVTVAISGENSPISKQRCEKLGVDFVMVGVNNKIDRLTRFLFSQKTPWENVCYIGDDLNDLECLKKVKRKACPGDAHWQIVQIKDIYVCQCFGGYGAVREFAELVISENLTENKRGFGNFGNYRNR